MGVAVGTAIGVAISVATNNIVMLPIGTSFGNDEILLYKNSTI